MIILEVEVIAKGADIGSRIGNPQPLKPGQSASEGAPQAAGSDSAPSTNGQVNGNRSSGNTEYAVFDKIITQ